MIRVVYDHQMFSRQEYGGVSRYFYEIATRVNAVNGYEARILSPLYYNAYLKQYLAPVRGVRVDMLARYGRLCRMLNQLMMPTVMPFAAADIVHETCYSHASIAPKGVPQITTVHDMIHENFPASFSANDTWSKHKRCSVERADKVICVSQSTKNDLISLFGVEEQKISVIHHGVNILSHVDKPSAPRIDRPYILYVGNRDGYKNFASLLRAFSNSTRLRKNFSIVAFGGGALSIQEKQLMQQLNLTQKHVIHMAGDDSCLAALYANAVLFVYPSRYEGFGMPVLEAMAYRCPVVCSNTSSLPEVAGDAALLFDPESIENLMTNMEDVVFGDQLAASLVKRGLDRVKQFSWERSCNETVRVYDNVT